MRLQRYGAVVLAAALSGCGGAGDVAGVVTIQGKPLTGCTIVIYDSSNAVQSSPLQDEGKYSVTKVAAGTAKVAILTPLAINIGPESKALKFTLVPAKYSDPDKSGLTFEVRSGPQTKNFDLE